MKTKELIKLLQEVDPSGECHVRMEGGIPITAYRLPGYYDGAYEYLDESGNWVVSTKGDKVDIITMDKETFICDEYDDTLHPEENWDNIKELIKIDYDPSGNSTQSIEYMNRFKQYFDRFSNYEESSKNSMINKNIEQANKGWTWFQNKLVDDDSLKFNNHTFYTWLIYDENGVKQPSNLINTEWVLKSGLWERLDNQVKDGYYQFIYKKI